MTERVFTVTGARATPAQPIKLADAGLRERSDLQEWVLAHPEILGPDVLIVTAEFDRWQGAGGQRERDRLDVLGLDKEGRLVVAELKRDRASDTVEMQAIKYAAMASRFTEEDLATQYVRFRSHRGESLDDEAALQHLNDYCDGLDADQLRQPRIVLVAGGFSPVVTASAVWLTEMGLDLTLQQVQAYRLPDSSTIVTVSQLFPVPDVEDFTVSPQRQQVEAAKERKRSGREKNTVARLVESGTIADGTELHLEATTGVTAEVRESVEDWVNADPTRGRARWFNDKRQPIEWEADGERYSPTGLVQKILMEVAGLRRSVAGPRWWVLDDGRTLPQVAGYAPRSGFDWGPLHEVLERIPAGKWTTYGDLAEVVGTAAQPLGQHITNCRQCPNAYRVLGADGRPRSGFAWSDSADARSQEDALRAEGVRFVDGIADQSQRLSAKGLATTTQ